MRTQLGKIRILRTRRHHPITRLTSLSLTHHPLPPECWYHRPIPHLLISPISTPLLPTSQLRASCALILPSAILASRKKSAGLSPSLPHAGTPPLTALSLPPSLPSSLPSNAGAVSTLTLDQAPTRWCVPTPQPPTPFSRRSHLIHPHMLSNHISISVIRCSRATSDSSTGHGSSHTRRSLRTQQQEAPAAPSAPSLRTQPEGQHDPAWVTTSTLPLRRPPSCLSLSLTVGVRCATPSSLGWWMKLTTTPTTTASHPLPPLLLHTHYHSPNTIMPHRW